jgi:hypothetical protein
MEDPPMASVKGPLFSLDASGTVAGTVTFAKWKGRNYLRQTVIPANPQTDLQTAVRAVMAFVGKDFRTLSPEQKAQWAELAQPDSITALNAYTRQAIKQARAEQGWKRYPSASDSHVPEPPTSLVLEPGFRQLRVTIQQPASKPNYAWLIYIILQPHSPRQFAALTILTYPDPGAAEVSATITNLDPGTYNVNARGLNEGGTLGDFMDTDLTITI